MRQLIITAILVLVLGTGYSQQSFKVDKSGKGTPVIMLPGFTCPGEIWDETAKHLGKDYQYLQITYAGFNNLAPIKLPWYSTIKEDLKKYIHDKKMKNVILIGHSMGGMLAMDLAAELPDNVGQLILVDALPCIRQVMMPHLSAEQITFDNPYNQQMLKMDAEAFKQNVTYMAKNMTNKEEKVSVLIDWMMTADRETYTYGYTELLKLDQRDKIADIKAKTLILAADFPNQEMTTKTVNAQFENIENKEVKIATSSKHFIMFDQPEWYYQQLDAFLKNNDGEKF